MFFYVICTYWQKGGTHCHQGRQMVYLQTKNTNLGKFWKALHRLQNVSIIYSHLKYFMTIWDFY
jgi:hypothetical protein